MDRCLCHCWRAIRSVLRGTMTLYVGEPKKGLWREKVKMSWVEAKECRNAAPKIPRKNHSSREGPGPPNSSPLPGGKVIAPDIGDDIFTPPGPGSSWSLATFKVLFPSTFQIITRKFQVLLLMAEILHHLIGSLSHYLQGFIHLRWCRIPSINSNNGGYSHLFYQWKSPNGNPNSCGRR